MDKLQVAVTKQNEELNTLAIEQPLAFLREAQAAFSAYSKRMRRESKRLRSGTATEFDVYAAWLDTYVPKLKKIRKNVADGKLYRPLKTVLLVDNELVAERMSSDILQLCAMQGRDDIRQLVHLNSDRACKMLEILLARSDEQISRQSEAAIRYQNYKMIAKKHELVVYDRRACCLRRIWTKWRSRRQERNITRMVGRQLRQNQEQTEKIEQFHDGLVAKLFESGIDLIEILAARQEYEKALAKITPSPTKKLDLYEKKTAKIRLPYLDARTDLSGVKDVQNAAKKIDDILLDIFDLNTTDKNSLLTSVKEYRLLVEEKQALDKKMRQKRD